jgi:hypothetical protein
MVRDERGDETVHGFDTVEVDQQVNSEEVDGHRLSELGLTDEHSLFVMHSIAGQEV